MKLLLVFMPALLFVTVCSVNIQRTAGRGTPTDTEASALPEATRIVNQQLIRCNLQRAKEGKPPIQLLPVKTSDAVLDSPSF